MSNSTPRLTQRRARAAFVAVNAMLAGEDHAGDWPEDVSREDLDAARLWLIARLEKNEEK